MWSCDPRRFTDYTDSDYCAEKAIEVYGHEYAMHFPFHSWAAGRNKKLSSNHQKILKNGGQMGAYNGWERANWFAKNGDDTSEKSTQTWNREGPWFTRVKEECLAINRSVGVLDLPGFSRFRVEGFDASEFLLSKISGSLPSIGRMNLAYFPDERGRVLTEMSIMRHDVNKFTLITAGAAQWHDCEILQSGLKKTQNVEVSDITNDWSCLIVTGPKSRDLMSRISNADLTLPWLSLQNTSIGNKHILLARVSYAGELGWEIHAKIEDISLIYDKVLGAGATPFGMYALDSLRVEKGYRAWKGDLSTDYSLLESGLERFIKFDKKEIFPGKQSLLKEKQRGSVKKFVTMIIKENECDAPYMSTIWHEGKIIGEVTSGAYGHRVNASIALGMVNTDLAISGKNVTVDIFGNEYPATIQNPGPLWDPQNEALKI